VTSAVLEDNGIVPLAAPNILKEGTLILGGGDDHWFRGALASPARTS